jgi:phospholipid/cholesterol/gamma-HCH transport system permease protein
VPAHSIGSDRAPEGPGIGVSQVEAGTLLLRLVGNWKLKGGLPTAAAVETAFRETGHPLRLRFDARNLGTWDSGLLAFLFAVAELCRARGVEFDTRSLPEGARQLLKLASAVPERTDARRMEALPDFLTLVGIELLSVWRSCGEMLEFLGQAMQSLGRLTIGRARFRRSDLIDAIFECGAAALPVVTLISFLVGLILALVGAVEFQKFGAQIYIADLVGIGTARETGILMTAIVMSGRTGAAFAAQIGTMQANEEIDALTTFGLSSIDFLVLPRMIALTMMMPLLCIYADLMGMLGGGLVGVGMFDVSVTQYVGETLQAVGGADFAVGIAKSAVLGGLVAVAGCMRGMQCGRSAAAVGRATTSAVVTGIVFIIVTDCAFAILTNALHI